MHQSSVESREPGQKKSPYCLRCAPAQDARVRVRFEFATCDDDFEIVCFDTRERLEVCM